MIGPEDQKLAELFAQKVREKYPEAQILVYGSRARGDYTPDSDLDICVVLKERTPEIREQISEMAWEVCFGSGVYLSTLVVARDSFEHGIFSASPLAQAIREDGIAA